MYLKCGDVSSDNAAGRSDRAPAYMHAGANQSPSANPGAVFDCDRFDLEAKSRIGPIVITRAEVCSLRNAYVGADRYRRKIVDPNILADPGVRGDGEVPRVFHADAWL